jgi:transposase
MGYSGIKTYDLVKNGYNRILEIIKRPSRYFWLPNNIKDVNAYLSSQDIDISRGFKVLPKRWIVERTFAWLDKYRRMHKDYEFLCSTSETMILAALSRTMLRRISKAMNF